MNNLPLRLYQEEAVRFIASRDGTCALFAEMGTGKTLIAIAYAEQEKDDDAN